MSIPADFESQLDHIPTSSPAQQAAWAERVAVADIAGQMKHITAEMARGDQPLEAKEELIADLRARVSHLDAALATALREKAEDRARVEAVSTPDSAAQCGQVGEHGPHDMPCDSGCQPDWHRDACAIYGKCPGAALATPTATGDGS